MNGRSIARAMLLVPTLVVGLAGCGAPLWAAPLASAVDRTPQALSAPMEDGTLYVLVESPTASAPIKHLWNKEAKTACEGDYLVLTEHEFKRSSGGVTASHIREGYVRCVSPEPTADVPENHGPPRMHDAT